MQPVIDLNHAVAIQFTDEQYERMKSLYLSGKSSRQISEIYGICQSSVLRRLRQMNITIRPVGSRHMP